MYAATCVGLIFAFMRIEMDAKSAAPIATSAFVRSPAIR
jgi:hypothetical protein